MYQFWGKSKNKDIDDNNYHLLVYHCLDVAAVCKQFLEKDNSFKIKISKLSGLDPETFESFFLFFIALHDIGKFSIRFQNRRPDILWELQQIKSNADNHPRHDVLGFHLWDRLLASCVIKHKLLPIGDGDELDWRDLFDPLARAVLGHHGKPPQADNLPLGFYFDENSQTKVLEFTKRLSELFFPAQNPKVLLEIEPYEQKLQAFNRLSWLFSGLSVLCDWIGSDERYFQFMKAPMSIEKYWHSNALLEAEKATVDCGILIPPVSKNSEFSYLFRALPVLQTYHLLALLVRGLLYRPTLGRIRGNLLNQVELSPAKR